MDGNPSADFRFNNTTPAVVTDIVKSLPASKAIGYDDIPSRLVKDSISILARPLCILFNSSIASNCFPTCWKSGQVTPVFKKDTEYINENYSPITVLVTFIVTLWNVFYHNSLLTSLRRNYHHTYLLTVEITAVRLLCCPFRRN